MTTDIFTSKKMHDQGSFDTARNQNHPWHTIEVEEIKQHLQVDIDCGLSSDDAAARLSRYGKNIVEEQQIKPWWQILIAQFLDPLIYILAVAAVAAAVFQEYIDAAVIVSVLIINGTIGFVQELRARSAIQSLAKMGAPRAEVLRSGHHTEIATEDIVPGDVVVLTSGTHVPADIRLFKAQELEVDESALTGESLPASKSTQILKDEHLVAGDQHNMVFAGTNITRGRARGIVVRTASNTEVGKIARAVREVKPARAPVQQKVDTLGKWIGVAIVGLTIIVALVGGLQGRPVDEIVIMAIAMAVAAIPEALPVVLTVTLAVGVRRMASRNAIIRTLPAVETLGSTTVIASDKTGTLTRNEMTVKVITVGDEIIEIETPNTIQFEDHSPVIEKVLYAGVLANEASFPGTSNGEKGGDPTELALLYVARELGLDVERIRDDSPQLDIIPFESDRQFMATLNNIADDTYVFIKGSPEAVLKMCTHAVDGEDIRSIDNAKFLEVSKQLASDGYRVLATAYKTTEVISLDADSWQSDCIFAGFMAMEDPVREEAVAAVGDAQNAGIRVLMITGDHLATARAIGQQLGLGREDHEAIEGRRLAEMSETEFDRVVRDVDIYARVAPEHKLKIVEKLKSQGHIVAVTGDGVNDAPALSAAHLGVAMGKGGTDVAREASDMVLTDDNFATITAAVEEGRVVFSNIRKVTYFLLSTAVGLVVTILFALVAGWPLPYVAVQVLWINLVTNGLQDVALAFEPREPGLLKQPPRKTSSHVLNRRVLVRMAMIGGFIALATLAVFWWILETTQSLELARSVAMTQIVLFQFFHVANCRSLHRSFFSVPQFSNPFLFVSVAAAFLAQLAVLYWAPLQFVFQTVSLELSHWLLVMVVGSLIVGVAEVDKWFLRRRGIGPGLEPLTETRRDKS